jgi:hypothetical protein
MSVGQKKWLSPLETAPESSKTHVVCVLKTKSNI